MAFLVDTNVLLRLAISTHPFHLATRRAIKPLRDRGESISASTQNFIEAWNVATRPLDRNGFGLSPSQADRLLRQLETAFPRLSEPADTYDRWRELVVRFGVSGVQVHDARLVAVMLCNGVSSILTFNTRDFERYAEIGIEAVDPRSVG